MVVSGKPVPAHHYTHMALSLTANNTVTHAGVQYILDTAVRALGKQENRRFIYVEMAFFTRWWKEQPNKTKDLVSA